MNNEPQPPSFDESWPVSSIAVGVFDTFGGGFLARFWLDGDESRLFGFSSPDAFDLKTQFDAALTHFAKHGAARTPFQRVQPLPAADFDHTADQIKSWYLNIGSDGLVWRLVLLGESDLVLRLSPAQVASLSFEVGCAIEQGFVIDSRPYNGMRWNELAQVVKELPGFQLGERLRAFEFSLEIFRRNARALTNHLERATGSLSREQLRKDRRFEISLFLKDAIHLLLNFVAAAVALVDHSRVFYQRHYETRNKLSHYADETERRFLNDGLVQFVHKLRVLMLHVGLVGLIHRATVQRGRVAGQVVMDRDVALMWDGWKAVARKWLEQGPPEVDLLETVTSYVARIEEFQAWYARERDTVDGREIRYAEQLRKVVLARFGLEQVPKLRELLHLPNTATNVAREAVGQFLNEEQLYGLRDDERCPERWFPKALDLARYSYFIPVDLCDALVQRFAPGGQLPSTIPSSLPLSEWGFDTSV